MKLTHAVVVVVVITVENIKWLTELNPITYHFMFEAYLGITLHFH